MELVEIFKAMSDKTRIRILFLLYNCNVLCNCDIENILSISQVNVSRHMNKLKQVKLINYEKKSQWVYYSINLLMLEKYHFLKELFKIENLDGILIEDRKNLFKYLEHKKKC